jgi:hypothetical protein
VPFSSLIPLFSKEYVARCNLPYPLSAYFIERSREEPLPGPPLKGREQKNAEIAVCSLPLRGGPGRGSSFAPLSKGKRRAA